MVLLLFTRGYTCTPTPRLFTSRAIGHLSLCLADWEQEKSDITLWSWLKGFSFFFFFSITFIEIAVCYWPRESQDHWILPKLFQKQKGGRGNSQLSWTKHLTLSCCTSHYRSMQEVQLDKHVKLVDSPGIVMDNSNSDSAVILRNCVKVRFHNVVQECPIVVLTWYNSLWLWTWLPHRLSKRRRSCRRLQDIAIIMYKAKNNMCPPYIKDIFNFDKPRYGLRNSSDFFIPRYNTTTYGRHSLRYVGPVILYDKSEYVLSIFF